MPVINLPLAKGYYKSETLPLAAMECINLIPVIPETPTISTEILVGSPGLELLATVTDINRGAHVFNGIPYFVNGTRLYRLDVTLDGLGNEVWTTTDLGEIPGEERVSIANNGAQMCIVVPELAETFNTYIVDTDDLITQVSDAGFSGPASSVLFVSGFFVFTSTDGNSFFKSALRNGLSYNALDFANAESDPDPIAGQVVYRNQLFIFGSKTMEGYQIVDTPDFPFIFSGVVERKGLIAQATLTEVDGRLYWLGSTARERPQILMYEGGPPISISTRAIEVALKKFSQEELEAAFSWDYAEDGADFIAFVFSSTAFVYDLSTQLWHERKSVNNEAQIVGYRISNIVDAYGYLIAGDVLNGSIGRLSKETKTEYGNTIQRRIVLPPIDNKGDVTIVSQVELVAQTGVGTLENLPGDEANIRLSWSDDGGRTFDGPFTESLGEIGEHNHRVIWSECGSFDRSRMFALDVSDPIDIGLYKLEVDIDY